MPATTSITPTANIPWVGAAGEESHSTVRGIPPQSVSGAANLLKAEPDRCGGEHRAQREGAVRGEARVVPVQAARGHRVAGTARVRLTRPTRRGQLNRLGKARMMPVLRTSAMPRMWW